MSLYASKMLTREIAKDMPVSQTKSHKLDRKNKMNAKEVLETA